MRGWYLERMKCKRFEIIILRIYITYNQGQASVHMYDFNYVQRGSYFGGEPMKMIGVEGNVGSLKNRKAAGKDEVIGDIVKSGSDMVANWTWRLSNRAFESGVVPENWRSIMIVPLYKGKGEMTECKHYRGINPLSLVGKIYGGILVERVCRVTNDEQGGFRSGRECVDQIFKLKQINEKKREEKRRVHVGFIDLEKAYERVNRETLWLVNF